MSEETKRKASGRPLIPCPYCDGAMKITSRPPNMKHKDKISSIFRIYAVCTECGRRGHSDIHTVLMKIDVQEDWVEAIEAAA